MRRVAIAGVGLLLLMLGWANSAQASGPVKDGWWTQSNVGLGFSAVPPQVPSDGLYVQNGFSGPIAISALVFDVPAGGTVGPLTLRVAGHPVITSPPVACPLTAAGRNFKPAQGGPWADRPAYACSTAKVTASVASDHSTVTFDVGPFLEGGVVAIAVLAGGPADQIAFDPPGADSLAVTPVGHEAAPPPPVPTPSGAPHGASGPAPAPAGGSSGISSPSGYASVASPSTAVPAAQPNGGFTPASPSVAPSLASPSAPPPPGTPVPTQSTATTGAGVNSSARHVSPSAAGRVGEILGLIGLAGLLVAYTQGYGLLGGRLGGIRPRRSEERLAS